MTSDTLLEDLRYRGEGTDLDFKAERYAFAKATPEEKSELLKDILALANASREGTAYILMGFKEDVPRPAEVVGLPVEGAIDDSRLQEFVNSKLDSKLMFHYEERLFEGKHVAVLSIPKQPRPFYLKKDFGTLKAEVVYVRRGSSTGIASPREIARMGEANGTRGDTRIQLLVQTETNEPLPERFERDFLVFPVEIPDYEETSDYFSHRLEVTNSDFYREVAHFLSCQKQAIVVRIMVENQSEFALEQVQLELTCRGSADQSAILCCASDMPAAPRPHSDLGLTRMPPVRPIIGPHVVVDGRGDEQVARIDLGNLRPGQTARADDDVVVMPSRPGTYCIAVRILANELPVPLMREHTFEVEGKVTEVLLKRLLQMGRSR